MHALVRSADAGAIDTGRPGCFAMDGAGEDAPMSAPRRAKARDRNEPTIIAALNALGWMVTRHDVYDLEAQCPRSPLCHLSIEVKNPTHNSQRLRSGLTASQKALQASGWALQIVYTTAEVEALVLEHMSQHHPNE